MNKESADQMLYAIRIDLTKVKTDVTWLKRLFSSLVIITGILLGIDTTGMI